MSRYIEKEKVIDLFKEYQPRLATNVYEFGEKLRELPTAEVKPIVSGDWVRGNKIRCSNCNKSYADYVTNAEDEAELLLQSNYCPFCGNAKKTILYYGEWININGIKTCNQCGAGNASAYDSFCPNCGAFMKKESWKDVCKDCYYNDGEIHAECVLCNKAESEEEE